jgi:Raf kinase inhibitor-like YbhB/YbcL family protein
MNTIILLIMSTIISAKSMQVTSPAFKTGDYIPLKYSCEGQNINPPIIIEDAPQQTVSIALIVDDPDATKGTFNHWCIWNIEPGKMIGEDSAPGVEGNNGAGKLGYTGPCPPAGTGTHHYHFKVFALNVKLSLAEGSGKAQLEAAMKGHVLTESELVGLYAKTK